MKWFDRKGIRIQLYFLFVGFAICIIGVTCFIQLFNIKQRLRNDTLDSLQDITWNISATYGTDAYEKAIRAAVYSGDYIIRTITEDGSELLSIGIVGRNVEWPQGNIDIKELVSLLNNSNGFINYEVKDGNKEWIVYAQVLASWEGSREMILVAQSTAKEKEMIEHNIFQLIQIGCIILIITLFLAWFLTRKFLKPIEDITKSAKMIAKGDFAVSLPKNTYTEINLLSNTLEIAANQFANYEQIRRDLIANLSHDMRTPLTMIKAYAEMIQTISGDNEEKRDNHLEVIISQADKLSEFVNASLDLARLQAKSSQLHLSKFSLGILVNEIILHLKVIYQNNVQFDINIKDKYMIKADRGMMEQVIYNLINNAIKYSGKVIHVNVRLDNKKVLFEVIDHGIGIAKEDLPQIWIKYYKVNPFAKDCGSTGVGLSIVKEILEQHDFAYGVESEVGKGCRFWFIV